MKTHKHTLLLLAFLSGASNAFAQTLTNITGALKSSTSQYLDDVAPLFDQSALTQFSTPHPTGWVEFETKQPFVVTRYALTSADNDATRDPKKWRLEGSNDGKTWAILDTQIEQQFPTRGARREFSFRGKTPYSRYRLSMTNSGGEGLQLANLELFGVPDSIKDITDLPGDISTGHPASDSPSLAKEGMDKLIDNLGSSKYLTSHGGSSWIGFTSGEPSVVTRYDLSSANDFPARDPKNWTLQGSNDGTTWKTLDTRQNESFNERLLKRGFSFANTQAFTSYRLNISNNDPMLQLSEWELLGTGGGGVTVPPLTWKEHWFDHVQNLSRVYYDNDVAVYHDPDVDRTVEWPNEFIGDAWRYTKKVYGDFGNSGRLFAVLHTGKYGGGHPSGYHDPSHDYRNVIDMGPGPWTTFDYGAWAIPTHEIGHIVEGHSNATHDSPAFGLWGDSKWMEIYQYDLYKGIGRSDYAQRWRDEKLTVSDKFPRANSFWFRDWFLPIYEQHGENQVLSRYFSLLAQNFPKEANGVDYARALNWGEFVHFWSGAAGVSLKPQATKAFGWPDDWENQFKQARLDFPRVTYVNP